jgi:hypothetical protein
LKVEEQSKRKTFFPERGIGRNLHCKILFVVNNKSIEERLTAFRTSLIPYVEEFGRELVRDFYDYWREVNGSGKKMRFEMEKVFNIDMRIKRWERNNKKFAKPSKKDESNMIKLPDGTMIDKKEYSKMFG